MAIHFVFFHYLDGRQVDSTIGQGLQTAIANILAILVEMSLLGGIAIAYNQVLWRVLRKRFLRASLIDTLVTLASSPWNVFRLRMIFSEPVPWLIGLVCALTPIAAVFPPGALTVESMVAAPITLTNVPTMNLSDYGSGGYREFVEKSFFEMNGDLSYMQVHQQHHVCRYHLLTPPP